MSTRCQIAFTQNSSDHRQKEAIVYRHYDGYPSGTGADLFRFFEEVRAAASNGDTRFDDPEYLAARLVTWLTLKGAASRKCDPLATTGVGVTQDYHSDIEYLYVVACRDRNADPQVYLHRQFDETSGMPLDSPEQFTCAKLPEPATRQDDADLALQAVARPSAQPRPRRF